MVGIGVVVLAAGAALGVTVARPARPATTTKVLRADTIKVVSDTLPKPVSYTFDDEFNGPAGAGPNFGLKKSYWSTDPCWKSGCGSPPDPTMYTSANATLNGHGDLVLTATNGAVGECGEIACRFTSARLSMFDWSWPFNGLTTFSQRYGTFSARIEATAGSNVWPSFWLLGSDDAKVGWPSAGGIDVFHAVGAANYVQQDADFGTAQYGLSCGGPAELPAGQTIAGWHTYSIRWSPTSITWYIDGKLTSQMTAARVGSSWSSFEHGFSVILELEIGGSMTPAQAAKELPAHMLVDWVRVSAQ